MKIMVVGYSCSGKSTFSKNLSEKLNIDLTHLDQLNFSSNWEQRPFNEFKTLLTEKLNQESWIIEGNYRKMLFDERSSISDQIFIFKMNRFRCFYNAIKRRIKYHNKVRPSAPKDSKEKLDFEFVKWLLFKGRSKDKAKSYEILEQKYCQKVIVFKNHKQVKNYFNGLLSLE